ncbi:MAG: hypothetical protein GKR94_18030 [Gammaproteobacteria bacterium]|nr:hypothetical protein [Gammaproteobacteria bacterium]
MEAYLIDWLNLLGRWLHLVVGIAWIGASFYFIWLDDQLEPITSDSDRDDTISGELWAVHGGGFYHSQKYRVSPPELPATLHWFKWEAYWTWLSGMFLLALIYWYQAEIYLIDPAVADISKPLAIGVGALTLAGGWFIYDGLCRSPLAQNDTWLSAALLLFVGLTAYGLCFVFGGRGAYMHYGAMLGTIMVANVFFVIIPGQQDLVTAKQEGRPPDPIHGIRGKQRSVHNTYFTLPVLFVMVSHHYAGTFNHDYNWLILIGLSLAGTLIRVYFVARHKGGASLWSLMVAGAIMAAIFFAGRPPPASGRAAETAAPDMATVDMATVQGIVYARCTGCHSAAPRQAGFAVAPKGFVLDSQAQIIAGAHKIHQQTVLTKAMPIGNSTKMTDEERALLDSWFRRLQTGQ